MHAHADIVIVDLVGDMDNFGFGSGTNSNGGGFDNSQDPNDLGGTFDQVETGESQTFCWTHDFTGSPNFGPGFVATSVMVDIPEMFADLDFATIEFDGMPPVSFTDGMLNRTGNAINRQFFFNGTNAAFANDGIVKITFKENGDDIALDFSQITVTGTTTGTNAVPEPSSCLMLSLVAGIAIARRRR
ncbi:PEP-CTERM sorting domain-containing protein [Mariniblastus sp.]|nr:PEP-CTERM sorting domain-containing protein [Mariniblastus sp.]